MAASNTASSSTLQKKSTTRAFSLNDPNLNVPPPAYHADRASASTDNISLPSYHPGPLFANYQADGNKQPAATVEADMEAQQAHVDGVVQQDERPRQRQAIWVIMVAIGSGGDDSDDGA